MRQVGGLPVLGWPAFDGLGVDAWVTTRSGGVSTDGYAGLNLSFQVGDDGERVLRNRRLLAAAIGAQPGDFVFCAQAHERSVQVVTADHRGRGTLSAADALPGTDALVTDVPGVVLAVMAADCVPLVLLDPVARVLAAVHAGWRGTVAGVTPAAVEAMTGLGADAERIVAGIGPAVHPDRYQVGAEVVTAAEEAFGPRAGEVVRPDGTGRWLFDLWRANHLQLRVAGVPDERIHVADHETGPGTPFYSHRFEAPCGRFAAVARLTA